MRLVRFRMGFGTKLISECTYVFHYISIFIPGFRHPPGGALHCAALLIAYRQSRYGA